MDSWARFAAPDRRLDQRPRDRLPSPHLLPWTLAVLTLVAGCAPVPLILPPTRLDVGGGGVVSSPELIQPGGFGGTFDGRATIHPLQVLESWRSRPADVGLGWGLQLHRGRTLHGPVVQFEYFPLEPSDLPPKGGRVRFGLQTATDLSLDDRRPGVGVGFSAGATVEWVGFETGAEPRAEWDPFTGGFIGYSVGEASIGAFAEISVRHHAGTTQGALVAGLTFRGPATVGLLLVPLLDLCL